MEQFRTSGFLFAVLLATSISSSYGSSPCSSADTKFIYDYESEVQVGIDDLVPVTSLYKLKGQLIVHRPLNSPDPVTCHRFQLKDVKYHSYHGNMEDHNNQGETYNPIPADSSDLYIPFDAYFSNITFEKMQLNSQEQQWSLNMKKALVNSFQLPSVSLIKEFEAFGIIETSMCGNIKPEYTAVNSDSGLLVTKVYSTSTCLEPFIHSIDAEQTLPDKDANNFQMFGGMKKYKVNTKEYSYPIIESIKGSEKMHNSLFKNNQDKRFVLTKQNIVLKQVVKDSKPSNEFLKEGGNYEFVTDLKYHQVPSENPFGLLYVTNGRSNFKGNHYDMALKQLHKVANHLEANHLAGDFKEIVQHQVVTELLMNLRYLNSNEIEKIRQSVTSGTTSKDIKMSNIFLEILPMVGTKASAMFVFNSLKSNVIDDDYMGEIIAQIPFYVLNYTKDLMDEAQVLLNMEKLNNNYSDLTTNTGILTYSIMFSKFCSQAGPNIDSCDHQSMNSVSEHFFKGVTENEDNYEKQLVYLEGLKNLNILPSANYLEKIISKNVNVNDNLRLRAMTGQNFISKFPSVAWRVCMPIFANTQESLELRAAALQAVVEIQLVDRPHKPFSLHWHMAGENSHRLYNYYYTILKSYADSVNPHHYKKKIAAEKILKVSRNPTVQSWDSSAWMYNYISQSSGSGGELVFRAFGDGKKAIPSMFYVEAGSISSSSGPVNSVAMHFRVKGLQDIFVQHIFSKLNAPTFGSSMNSVTEDLVASEPLHLEVIMQNQGYTNLVLHLGNEITEKKFNYESLGQVRNVLQKALTGQAVVYDTLVDRTYMTDIGVPVMLNMHNPILVSIVPQITSSKIQVDFRLSGAGGANLLVFNPVANNWHGISRVESFDLQLPVNANFNYDRNEKTFEFSLQKQDDGYIGLQLAARTYSGIFSGDSAVPTNLKMVTKKYSPSISSSPFEEFFAKALEALSETVAIENEHLAYRFSISKSGCRTPIPSDDISSSHDDKGDSLAEDSSYLDFIPDLSSTKGNCSMRMVAAPTENSAGSKFSIRVKVDGSEIGGNLPLPGYKYNVQATIQMNGNSRNSGKTILVNTDVKTSPNGVNTSIKSKISSSVNGVASGDPIYIDYEKIFPPVGKDSFQYGWGDESVQTRVAVKMSDSQGNSISGVQLSIKGEISNEQKRLASSDVYPYNQCEEDKKKPEWQGPLWPRTWACFEGAIKLFYTRKVTLEMTTQNAAGVANTVESGIANIYKNYVQLVSVGDPKLSDDDNNEKKIIMEVLYSATEPTKDIKLVSSSGSYRFKGVPGIGRDIYNLQLDNTHFSKFLQIIESTAIDRSCVASTATILTPDNSTVSHQFGSNYDTLSKFGSGKYGVYAKKSANGLVAKVIVGDATLEISGNSATLNGQSIQNLEQGFQYPPNEPYYYFRVLSNQGQITVYSRRVGFYVVYSPVSITLDQPIFLKGFVNGLCGDLA